MSLENEDQINEPIIAPPSGPKLRLSGRIEEEVEKSFAEGNADEGTRILQENGFSPTDIVRLASHYSRELEESILRIAWNKKRLMYATAILEHTLAGENKKVASVENLIKNYLIFNKIFQGKEGKLPRFGQFAYVMRNIFKGVATNDDIYDCIANHKTFGEGISLDRKEVDSLSEEIEKLSQEVEQNFAQAAEKRKILEGSMAEAEKEEEQEKGNVWTPAYSEPNEYFFPNYTFQTGTRKGLNHARGRSSWEPMFLAYADVVNKRMEDWILSRSDMSDGQKREQIKRHRIELLYEPFDFPVDIKATSNGAERPVIYRLDFIDINRWRAIEVKGPLTPKGAEKIKLFQKYYVEGDFSDLPEDKRILMMSYVQDKKDEIAQWCEERGYPVFDHFSSLSVLGAWKWDPAINNFNRYSRAKDMPGLTERQKEQLQKGFFKMVEDRIGAGKTPDIRPEGYQRSDGILKLVKTNKKEAEQKKIPYEINKPSSTKPYIPDAIAETLIQLKKRDILHRFPALIRQKVLETIPLSQDKKTIISQMHTSSEIAYHISQIIQKDVKRLNRNELQMIMDGKLPHRIEPPYTSREDFEEMISGLEIFRGYLLELLKTRTDVNSTIFDPANLTRYIKDLTSAFKEMLPAAGYKLNIDRNVLEKTMRIRRNIDANGKTELPDIIQFYEGFLLGEYKKLFDKRLVEIEGRLANYSIFGADDFAIVKDILKNNKNGGVGLSPSEMSASLIYMTFQEEKIPGLLAPAFGIANENFRKIESTPAHFFELAQIAEIEYKSIDKAANHFSSHAKSVGTAKDYSEVLNKLNSSRNGITNLADDQREIKDYLWEKEKILVSMAKIIILDKIGEEACNRLDEKFNSYYSSI
ncbi:MAG: hypothetical protein NT093_02715 [Candidatus Moranbacteria bacterium]|nr:hypothetical protein [Candidatus Moranbacteria bacterium]